MMNCKYISVFAALCIAAVSLTGCSKDGAPANTVGDVTSAVQQSETVTEKKIIGLEEAENAALAHAGVSTESAKITKAELDRDKGNLEYEIEFTAENYKYEYDINAEDGSVMKFSKEAVPTAVTDTIGQPSEAPKTEVPQTTETAKPQTTTQPKVTTSATAAPAETQKPTVTTTSPAVNSGTITAEEAKSAALKHAGLTASEVTFTKSKLDYDDGVAEYEIEFYTESTEYEYEINAATGAVIKYSKETLERPAMNTAAAESSITLEDAKAIALEYAGLSDTDVKFTKTKLDYDDGRAEYEIEFLYGRKEYEFTIDVSTGKILEYDVD